MSNVWLNNCDDTYWREFLVPKHVDEYKKRWDEYTI